MNIHDGEIFPMTGGTINHNQIVGNFYAAIKYSDKRTDYRVFMSEVKLWIPQIRRFTYPDVIMTHGQPDDFENRRDTITNPLILKSFLNRLKITIEGISLNITGLCPAFKNTS